MLAISASAAISAATIVLAILCLRQRHFGCANLAFWAGAFACATTTCLSISIQMPLTTLASAGFMLGSIIAVYVTAFLFLIHESSDPAHA